MEQENPPYGECYSCQINDAASHIVAGYSNGFINVFNINDRNKRAITFKASDTPITSVKWNKHLSTTFITASSDGKICHWHSSSGKILHTLTENGNHLNSLDYSNDYKKFASGGSDLIIRVYDEGMKTKITEMKPFKFDQPGHSSRVFCVRFNPDNNNMIISGGWDKTIQIYDVREGQIINSIYGTKICGEALDINSYYIIAAGWGQERQISIYDIRMLKSVCTVNWENGSDYNGTYLYCAKFDALTEPGKLFGVGGVNRNLFRIYDWNGFNSAVATNRKEDEPVPNMPIPIMGSDILKSACYTMDFYKISNKKEYLAYGCGDGGVRLLTLEKQ